MTIIHLPVGRYCIEHNGVRSQATDYENFLIATIGSERFIAQTKYFGHEEVVRLGEIVPHDTLDMSTDE